MDKSFNDVNKSTDFCEDEEISIHRVSSSPHSRSRSPSFNSYRRHSGHHHSDSQSNSSCTSSRSYSRSRSRSRSKSRSPEHEGLFPEKDPRDRSMRHQWSNTVWMIGEKVKGLTFHICGMCDKPIVIYGRLKPCNHVFCLTCALSLSGECGWCKVPYVSCDRHLLGNIYQCTEDPKCRRTYMSQRDLHAHINYRHKKLTNKVIPPSTSNPLKSAVSPINNRPPTSAPQTSCPSSVVQLQSNLSAPQSSLLSVGPVASTIPPPSKPHNALLVPPPSGKQMGQGNTSTTEDFATIAALAAAIQTNPNTFPTSLATPGSFNLSRLCPPSSAPGNFPQQQPHAFPQTQNSSPRIPENSNYWSSHPPQL